ncbi:MAG: urea ABC transporter permease subunit UrtB [Clostridia bacterium]
MELLLSQLITGLSSSAELFLTTIGLVIIFGMLDVVNMAHGEFIMLGAYSVCVFNNNFGIPFFIAVILSFVFTAFLGCLLEHFVIRKFYGKVAETLLATFALTYILPEIVKSFFGPENQKVSTPIPGNISFGHITIPYYDMFIVLMAVVFLLGTLILFYKTKFGIQLRSITQNRQMSQCLGLNSGKIDKMTFAYGCGLGGAAGALLAPVVSVTPSMGTEYVVDSFLVVILGGLDSIIGSFFGSFVIEESTSAMSSAMSMVNAKLLIFIIIIVLIRFKPQGLFTAKDKR